MQNRLSEGMKRLNHIVGELNGLYHSAAVKLGLTDSELQILYALYTEGDGCPLQTVCKLSGMCKQTLNSAIRKMEREKIVYLTATNGRDKALHLTEAGQNRTAEKLERLVRIENEVSAEWEIGEWEEYLRLAQKHGESFKEKLAQL